MQKYFHFKPKYFLIALLIFAIEVLIERSLDGGFIRFVAGDFLIVILMYFSLKSILKVTDIKLAIGVLLFAYTVEILQYVQILKYFDWQDSYVAKIILGTTFEWRDMLAYTLGVGSALIIDRLMS